ncbi:MAG: hypothetical protein EOO41_01550, partial [Methanobacteriota archaeon]
MRAALPPPCPSCAAAQLDALSPAAVLDIGGRQLALSGASIASLLHVAHAHANAKTFQGFGVPPAEPEFVHPPDETGLIPIRGVAVRYTMNASQPGRRAHDVEDESGQPRIFYSKAYYPPELQLGAQASSFELRAFNVPHKYTICADGVMVRTTTPTNTLSPLTSRELASAEHAHISVDRIVALAPPVSQPCVVTVELLASPPAPPVAATSPAIGAYPWPIAARTSSAHDQAPTLSNRAQILPGSATLCFHALPTISQASPALLQVAGGGADSQRSRRSSRASALTLTGPNLFGCALIDGSAGPTAERLIDDVQASLNAREAAEVARVASQLNGSASTSSAAGDGSSELLHMASSGTEDGGDDGDSDVMHHDVLVRFKIAREQPQPQPQVDSGSGHAAQHGSVSASQPPPTVYSQPVHGTYVLRYDERRVAVDEAVNTMTGTTAAAGSIQAMLGANTGGVDLSELLGRPSTSSTAALDAQSDEVTRGDGVLGAYTASIRVRMPELTLPGANDDLLGAAPSELLTRVHQWLSLSARHVVYAAQLARGDAPPLVQADETDSSALPPCADEQLLEVVRVNRTREFGARKADVLALGSRLLLVPEVSVNGGVDFIPAASGVSVSAFCPAPRYCDPPVGPACGGFGLTVVGTGFIDAPTICLRFSLAVTPMGADHAAIIVPATFVDCCTLTAHVPDVRVWLPADQVGSAAVAVEVSIDGASFTTN